MIQRFVFILCLTASMIGCKSENGSPETSSTTDSIRNEFLISAHHVGKLTQGMTVADLYDLFPEEQVKIRKSQGEYSETSYDDFYVYDSNHKLLYIASPEKKNDEKARIERVIIKDNRFVTTKGISISSNIGEIEQAYGNVDFIPSINDVILFVPEINSNFEINRKSLGPGWLDEAANSVNVDSIPKTASVTALTIFWKSGKGTMLTGSFWNELLQKFLNWIIMELPSIAVLTILFIFLMRLQIFVVHRLRKMAIIRAHKAVNVDNDEAEKRINTLSGIVHGIGRILLWTIFILILLGKFNINIAPILASAGIVGLAVGFGAQELVRDFISGFFILLENQLRTGDMAIINGTTGLVEKIEMRTVTLRDASGVVHIFQNGKINTLSNMTKEWSAIVLDIGVAYKEDTDYVSSVMSDVGKELQNDPAFQDKILEPAEILGVDSLADSSVIIKVRLKTKPMQQWAVGREYRRRLKYAFDKKNIEIPFPHISIYTGEATKPMPLRIIDKPDAKEVNEVNNNN